MLVWSAILAAVVATDTTRPAADPKVTITVDSSRKELVVTAGPFDLPNMPPREDHGMMDHGESHDTPIQRFRWPIEGWLRGFELELKDGQGNPVLFKRALFPELLELQGDQGARPIIQKDPARVEWVDLDLAMPADVDTPGDYEKIRAALRNGPPTG